MLDKNRQLLKMKWLKKIIKWFLIATFYFFLKAAKLDYFTVYQLFTEYQTKRARDTSIDVREHMILFYGYENFCKSRTIGHKGLKLGI